MRTLQASTCYGVGIPSFVALSRLRLRHRHVILAKVEHSEKSVEIMRKYARKSGTYFCVDKGVTSVVIKVITRINYGQSISISGLAGMSMASVGGIGGALLSLVVMAVDVSLVVTGFGDGQFSQVSLRTTKVS